MASISCSAGLRSRSIAPVNHSCRRPINAWSARRRLWRVGISSEEISQQLGRASIGLLLYTGAVGLAFVNAIASLMLCAVSAVYYAFPSRV
jgi:hypothetical protein